MLLGGLSKVFFSHLTCLQPSLSRKLPQTQLPNCCESHLVEFPFLFAQPILELFQLLYIYSGLYVLQQLLKPQFLNSGCMFTVSTVAFFCFFDNKWYNNIYICAEWKISQSIFGWFTKTSSSFRGVLYNSFCYRFRFLSLKCSNSIAILPCQKSTFENFSRKNNLE